MKTGYQQMQEAQLERKLSLLLGSPAKGEDWLSKYAQWLADNDVDRESMSRLEDSHMNLFVQQTRKARAA